MAAKIFGNRLKQARRAAGLSLRDLAGLVGLSHAAIQKYEKGVVFPSSDCLIKLAKAIHVPIEHLFRPETVELGSLRFRKKSTLLVKAIRKIEYQIRDRLERRLELENCYPSPQIKIFDVQQVPSFEINTDADVEGVAVEVRTQWNLGLAPIHDLVDVLENNGIRVIEVDTDENGFDGLFVLANDEPVVVISKKWPGDRQRFTLAHELGHLFLQGSLPADLNEEKACNHFAGAFLFPKPSVLQEFGKTRSSVELRELLLAKQEYGLSMSAVVFRLFQSGIITPALFRSWQIRISKEGWRKLEPGKQLPSEMAHVFEQMIFHALGEEYISEAKAAELLGVSIDSFRRLRMINERTCTNG